MIKMNNKHTVKSKRENIMIIKVIYQPVDLI